MELKVIEKKKKALQKLIAENKKGIKIIRFVSKILLAVGIFGGAAYLLINFFAPSLSIVNVNGVPQKDVSAIIITSSLIIAPTVILAICLKALAGNLAGSDNSARIDESIIVSSEFLRYSFRLKHQTLPCERRVITIKFNSVSKVVYDAKTEKISFVGTIQSDYFDDYKKSQPVDSTVLNSIDIYDYFSPSLKEKLSNSGIKFQ